MRKQLLQLGLAGLLLTATPPSAKADKTQNTLPDYEVVTAHLNTRGKNIQVKYNNNFYEITDTDYDEDGFLSGTESLSEASGDLRIHKVFVTEGKSVDPVIGLHFRRATSILPTEDKIVLKKIFLAELKKGRKFKNLYPLEKTVELSEKDYQRNDFGDWFFEHKKGGKDYFISLLAMNYKNALGIDPNKPIVYVSPMVELMFSESAPCQFEIYDEKTNRLTAIYHKGDIGLRRKDLDEGRQKKRMPDFINNLDEILKLLKLNGTFLIEKDLFPENTEFNKEWKVMGQGRYESVVFVK